MQHTPQLVRKVGRRRVAVLHFFRERLQANSLELGRNIAGNLARRLGLVVANLPQELSALLGPEGDAAAEHLVEDDSQGVDVRAAVDPMGGSAHLLRRHVSRRAGDNTQLVAAGGRIVEREPKIDQHRLAARSEDDVRRFHVAVDGQLRVGVGQRVGHSRHDGHRVLPGHGIVSQPASEVVALEIVGNDVDLSILRADVVHRDDPAVTQPGQSPRFEQQTLGLSRRCVGAATKDFDGDGPVELGVVAEVHGAEAALAELLAHFVAAESGGRRSRRSRDRGTGDGPRHERRLRLGRVDRKVVERRRGCGRRHGF